MVRAEGAARAQLQSLVPCFLLQRLQHISKAKVAFIL